MFHVDAPSNIDSCTGKPRFTFSDGEVDRADRPYANPDRPDSFTLHLRITSPRQLGEVAARCATLLTNGVILGYCGGDSFFEWCEPFGHHERDLSHGWAVHIHFAALSTQGAGDLGVRLAMSLGVIGAHNATMSEGEDWAVQFECFEGLGRIRAVTTA